jgi:hypothetical protein
MLAVMKEPNHTPTSPDRRVRITVRGRLTGRLATAFEGMTLVSRRGRTDLVGEVVDQAQLYGLLARIRDLGLELEALSTSPGEHEEA